MSVVRRFAAGLGALCVSCGPVAQPTSLRTVAAFEVPLPNPADKAAFLTVMRAAAAASGYHVDSATSDELRQMSTVSPITFNAAVWRGNDKEAVASAMDFRDHIGRVWLMFALGEDPERVAQFRNAVMPQIKRRWPGTTSLPIMPTGSIPNSDDLVRTPAGYKVKRSAMGRYQLSGPFAHP